MVAFCHSALLLLYCAGTTGATKVAVLREAFKAFDEPCTPLSQVNICNRIV